MFERHRRYRRRDSVVLVGLLTACAGGGAPVATPDPAPVPAPAPAPERPYVVMVSFDGMRYDFPDRAPTPAFDRLARAGVRASGLIPAYPSKTFPNHYTLATGLYPVNHGIVDNAFYDPAFDAVYALGDTTAVRDGRWYDGEPIWVTAERQGVTAASFFWVGSEAPVQGVRPTYFKYYDGSVPNAARVDTVLDWLDRPPDQRPHLVLLYFSDVDHVAHRVGPDHPAVDSVVAVMDGVLDRLLDGIDRLPIRDHVNVIVVSDHGMAALPGDAVVYLEDLADLAGVRVVENTTQAMLYFDGDESRMWSVYEALGERLTHATVYLKEELPNRWHYGDSRRIGELVVAADPGWRVAARRPDRPWRDGGMHGWDPYFRPMHGIFFAAGPAIVPTAPIAAFENIHVYPFVARILDLEPAAVDGDLEILGGLLTPAALAH